MLATLMPPRTRLFSIEAALGFKRQDIISREERFVVRNGQVCLLARKEKVYVCFRVPVRHK